MIGYTLKAGAIILCTWLVAAAQAELKYETFHGTADGFSVVVPFALDVRGDADGLSGRKYLGGANGTWVYVFSEPDKRIHDIDIVKQFVRSNGKAFAPGSDFQHASTVSFMDGYGYWQRVTAFKANGRTYVLQVVSENIIDPIGDRFASSFKFERAIPPPNEKERVEPVPEDKLELQPLGAGDDRIGQGSGSGTGMGQGVGSGTGTGTGTSNSGIAAGAVTGAVRTNARLKILSKPSPSYTALARVYEITGTVIMRVKFLDNGQIGDVSITKRLPFGLTESALAAAKSMRFEPQVSDGKPVTVIKSVEYNFSIY
ncbi:MAG: energy transducer TonB [Pyrinomonadaceae bacterium]